MASLLHVERDELAGVIVDLARALRPGGVMFAGFKHGQGDRVDPRDGRAFTDMDARTVQEMLEGKIEGLELVETSLRTPPDTQTNQEAWFSCVLQRTGPRPSLKRTVWRPGP